MGQLITRLLDFLSFNGKDVRLLLLGLDAAGKTTVLYRLKIGETTPTVPTVGFNVEEVTYKKTTLTMWDVGGQDKLRPLWNYYFRGSKGLIYVVDSNDMRRMETARDELHRILSNDEMRECTSVLVLANKQDLPGACSVSTICDRMCLKSLRNQDWYCQGTIARTGDGLYEGIDWIVHSIKDAQKRQAS